MSASDFLSLGLDVLIEHFPAVFVWNGTQYTGKASSTKDTSQMKAEGFLPESDLSINIAITAFSGTLPEANQTLTKGGETYVIQAVNTGPEGAILTLVCNRLK